MNALTDRIIAQQEQKLGAELDYLRALASSSTAAFAKFGLAGPLLQHRKHLTPSVWHLARLAATRVQDCGTCVQIVVNAALADGVARTTLRGALVDQIGTLTPEETTAWHYGEAVASRDASVSERVAEARQRFGEAALAELALAVATVQLFPILKRGLGQDVACRLVHVEV